MIDRPWNSDSCVPAYHSSRFCQLLWNSWVAVSQVHMWKEAKEHESALPVHLHRGDRQPDCTPDVIMIASYYLLCFLWYCFQNNKPIYVRRHSIIPSCGTMYGDLVYCLLNYCQPVLTYRLHLVFFYLRIIRCTVRKVYYLLFLY